jgi:hypothetical protein
MSFKIPTTSPDWAEKVPVKGACKNDVEATVKLRSSLLIVDGMEALLKLKIIVPSNISGCQHHNQNARLGLGIAAKAHVDAKFVITSARAANFL